MWWRAFELGIEETRKRAAREIEVKMVVCRRRRGVFVIRIEEGIVV